MATRTRSQFWAGFWQQVLHPRWYWWVGRACMFGLGMWIGSR